MLPWLTKNNGYQGWMSLTIPAQYPISCTDQSILGGRMHVSLLVHWWVSNGSLISTFAMTNTIVPFIIIWVFIKIQKWLISYYKWLFIDDLGVPPLWEIWLLVKKTWYFSCSHPLNDHSSNCWDVHPVVGWFWAHLLATLDLIRWQFTPVWSYMIYIIIIVIINIHKHRYIHGYYISTITGNYPDYKPAQLPWAPPPCLWSFVVCW